MYAIIRLRGSADLKPAIKYTLELLRLHRVNHCVVVEENAYYKGMLQKVKDYVAWGEISEESLAALLEKRGRLEGGDKLSEEYLRDKTDFESLKALTQALYSGEQKMRDLMKSKIKPVFRLHPPRKGHKGIKRSVKRGGELGYHSDEINALLRKMR